MNLMIIDAIDTQQDVNVVPPTLIGQIHERSRNAAVFDYKRHSLVGV